MSKDNNRTQERFDARILPVLSTVTDDNIDEIFARYNNRLIMEADHGIDKEEYEFLLELNELLRGFIVQKFMKGRGWYQSADDDWNRWERE